MPACGLYHVYSTTFFMAWTRVNCASKTYEDDPKTSPNNNCMGVSTKFSNFAGKEKQNLGEGEAKPRGRRSKTSGKERQNRGEGEAKPRGRRGKTAGKERQNRGEGEAKPWGRRGKTAGKERQNRDNALR